MHSANPIQNFELAFRDKFGLVDERLEVFSCIIIENNTKDPFHFEKANFYTLHCAFNLVRVLTAFLKKFLSRKS